jgi:microsomal dipeptidase-like Zn-dependent dipeptidase
MAASETLERFSNEVMSEAFKAIADSDGVIGVGVGDAFIDIGVDCP